MSDILQTNIFFVITSVAVVVVTILVAVILVYVLYIVRNLKEMSDRLKEGSELLAGDFKELHEKIRNGNGGFKNVLSFVLGKVFTRRRRNSRRSAPGSDAA